MADSKETAVAVNDNRRNALVFVNAGTEDTDRVSGYYRDENLKQFAIAGTMTDRVLQFRIVDEKTQEPVGTCSAEVVAKPETGKPLAKGNIEFGGDTFPVCVWPAQIQGKRGYGVRPDQMPEQKNGRW